jgi:hypothetical protein
MMSGDIFCLCPGVIILATDILLCISTTESEVDVIHKLRIIYLVTH